MDGDVSKMENIIRIREGKEFAHQIQLIQPIENDTFKKDKRGSKKIHYAQQQMDFLNNI